MAGGPLLETEERVVAGQRLVLAAAGQRLVLAAEGQRLVLAAVVRFAGRWSASAMVLSPV